MCVWGVYSIQQTSPYPYPYQVVLKYGSGCFESLLLLFIKGGKFGILVALFRTSTADLLPHLTCAPYNYHRWYALWHVMYCTNILVPFTYGQCLTNVGMKQRNG